MKTWKLVSGIFTILFSFFSAFSGIVFGIDNAIKHKADEGDSYVLVICFFLFLAGLVSICVRKSKIAGNIAIIVLFGITAAIGFSKGGSQGQWHVVGGWSVICAAISMIPLILNIKNSKKSEASHNNYVNRMSSSRKCPYCQADVPVGSNFCGACGKELPKEIVCPNCGKTVDANARFCSSCGKSLSEANVEEKDQSQTDNLYDEEEESPIKKSLPYIIGTIVLIAVCGSGWWYYNSSKTPKANNDIVNKDSIAADSVAAVAEAVKEDFAADSVAVADVSPMEQALNAYEPILDKYIAKGEANNHWEEYYFLHDVTGDGIPELWLHVDGGESYNLLAFTYKDGQTKQISSIDVGHPSHHTFYRGSDYILMVFAHMGSSSWTKYEYKNGKIQGKEIYSEELNGEDENAEYKEPSESLISPIEITNKQELHNMVY